MCKGDCHCIDLGIDHYEVITISKKSVKAEKKPVFAKMYVVYVQSYSPHEKHIKYKKGFKIKKEAEQFALEEQLKNLEYEVIIKHEPIIISGDSKVQELEVSVRGVKTMSKALKPLPNRRVKAIHKYLFYGIAPC